MGRLLSTSENKDANKSDKTLGRMMGLVTFVSTLTSLVLYQWGMSAS